MRDQPVLRLKILGTVRLEAEDERPVQAVLSQPKRLALLAYLAAGAPRELHRRDRLVAHFWPESDTARARNSLSQALSHLRRHLGEGVIVTEGAEAVGVDHGVLTCDAVQFERLVAEKRPEEALSAYGGDLLDGFHVSEAPGFEQWLELQRDRLRELALAAAGEASERAERQERVDDAVRWARRGLEISPANEPTVRRLLRLLAIRDPAGALAAYDSFSRYLAADFGLDPSDETRALAVRIRAHASASSEAGETSEADQNARNLAATAIADPLEDAAAVETLAEASGRRRPRWKTPLLLASALVLATLLAAPGGGFLSDGVQPALAKLPIWGGTRHAAVGEATANVIAVLPFSVERAPAYLGEAVASLLTAGLDGAASLRTADHRAVLAATGSRIVNTTAGGQTAAERLGAGRFVLGEILGDEIGTLRIEANVYERTRPDSLLVRVVVEGVEGNLFALVDELSRKLLATASRPSDRLTAVAAANTNSLAAFRAYIEGVQATRHGQRTDAVEAFQRAVVLDTGFAIAYYRLSEAADWIDDGNLVERAAADAAMRSDRLTPRHRRLLEGFLAWRSGDTDRAEHVYRELTHDYPNDVEAWYQLGEVRFHSGPLRGRSLNAARAPFERVLELEPDNGDAAHHLHRILVKSGEREAVTALEEPWQIPADESGAARVPALGSAHWVSMMAFEPSRAMQLAGSVDTAAETPLWTTVDRGAVYAENLEVASRLVVHLGSATRSDGIRSISVLAHAHLEAARGRFYAADSILASASHVTPAAYTPARAYIAALPFLEVAEASAERISAALTSWDGGAVAPGLGESTAYNGLAPELRAYPEGLLGLALRDSGAVLDAVKRLEDDAVPGELKPLAYSLAMELSASLRWSAGDLAGALVTLDSVDLQPKLYLQPTVYGSQVRRRWIRAEILRLLGREAEAMRWYESMASTRIYEISLLAPSHLRRAQILEGRAGGDSAAYHYRRFAALWADADVSLQPLVQDALARAERQKRTGWSR